MFRITIKEEGTDNIVAEFGATSYMITAADNEGIRSLFNMNCQAGVAGQMMASEVCHIKKLLAGNKQLKRAYRLCRRSVSKKLKEDTGNDL